MKLYRPITSKPNEVSEFGVCQVKRLVLLQRVCNGSGKLTEGLRACTSKCLPEPASVVLWPHESGLIAGCRWWRESKGVWISIKLWRNLLCLANLYIHCHTLGDAPLRSPRYLELVAIPFLSVNGEDSWVGLWLLNESQSASLFCHYLHPTKTQNPTGCRCTNFNEAPLNLATLNFRPCAQSRQRNRTA